MTRRAIAVWVLVIAMGIAGPAVAQTTPRPEVKVTATDLKSVPLEKLPSGGELQVRGTLTDVNAFSTPEFTNLISAVQANPGSEVKLLGTVGGKRFEAKVEGGEVKLQGLTLTQDQLNALSTQLQKTSGVREFRIRAVVDGKPMVAKFENGQLRTEMRRPDRVERGDRSDRTDRAERADRVERPERSGKSPLRPDIRHHRNVKTLVQETMGLLRSLPQPSARGEGPGLEANGAIVVTHDNVDRTAAALVTVTPAPHVGDPIHYDSFLRRLCDSDTHRWSVGRSSD